MKKILIIIICLIAITGCYNKNEELNEKDYKEEIATLLENSYNLSLFAYGKLEYEDSIITIKDKQYKQIKNDSIKTINELNNLLENVYVPERLELFYETLYSKKEFVEIENKIYVNDKEESCDIGDNYDFTSFNISLQTDENLIIDIDEFSYYVYIRDNKLYLSDDVYKCLSIKQQMINKAHENLNNN